MSIEVQKSLTMADPVLEQRPRQWLTAVNVWVGIARRRFHLLAPPTLRERRDRGLARRLLAVRRRAVRPVLPPPGHRREVTPV
jgi:hypothetical protein